MEEPGGLQSMGLQSRTRLSDFTHSLTQSIKNLNKWLKKQGEKHGRGALNNGNGLLDNERFLYKRVAGQGL